MAAPESPFDLAADAARQLRAALDQQADGGAAVDRALSTIAQSVVRAGLAEWCLVELSAEGARELRLIAVAHGDESEIARARSAHAGGALASALGWSESHAAPLEARGRRLGVLTLAGSGRPLAPGAAEQAALLAGLMAGAVDTALLIAERDEMLSVVSHDLRNPLGVILLVVDLLRGLELPDEISGQMSRLERASQTMSRIVTDVVDVGRLGTPAVPLELGSLSAAAALEAACQASAAAAAAKGVEFERAIDPSITVTADKGRLARALDLLVSGAVTRTPSRRTVAVGLELAGDLVVFSVADGAPPMPPDPVRTGSVAIRRRTGAFTWMVVRGVARAHGGAVWIDESAERVTVYLALPHATADRLSTRRASR
jgi:signal transduction histidine kinase